MTDHKLYRTAKIFAKHLRGLHSKRRTSHKRKIGKLRTRISLSATARADILEKTGSRCHLCGGSIKSTDSWAADHVLAYAHGGLSSPDNYLPAHRLCNNYRWHYG